MDETSADHQKDREKTSGQNANPLPCLVSAPRGGANDPIFSVDVSLQGKVRAAPEPYGKGYHCHSEQIQIAASETHLAGLLIQGWVVLDRSQRQTKQATKLNLNLQFTH
ncbi:hypothetical protein [Ensifer sp. M14]|uniref:hypothetical protein n=1 Tax=Ensifer sp. M14 TaxID=2203782 RepID=UPI001FCEE034|nr:hypothetical protein [Ensifer sp. M14]